MQSNIDSQHDLTIGKEPENPQVKKSLRNQSVAFLSRTMSLLKLGTKIETAKLVNVLGLPVNLLSNRYHGFKSGV